MAANNAVHFDTPSVFKPLWTEHARLKGAYGGRGSGKSHDRAAHAVLRLFQGGARVACLREVQNSLKDSVKQLIEDKIADHGLYDYFETTRDEIRGPNKSLCVFKGLKDQNAASIKSLEGFDVAWVEEAQTITDSSLQMLTPTIRKAGSELWFTWNPRLKTDPVDVLLRKNPPDYSVVVRANYEDNEHFPAELRLEMERDRVEDPEKYEHVWLGGYERISAGAYYAKELTLARLDGRVTSVPYERGPLVYTAWDIGVDDVTAIWFMQPVGREVHLIDYYQSSDNDAAHYAGVIRNRPYEYAEHILPHDAGGREKATNKTYEQHLREAEIPGRTKVLPRTNDVLTDINVTRGFLSKCWFDERKCEDGLDALGSYRRRFNEAHQTFSSTPLHDWASHAADAFRYLATGYAPAGPAVRKPHRRSGWAA